MKKRKLNESEEQLYKKRIKVEHTNQKIKAYRRLNYVYEKEIKNYNQLIYLCLNDILIKKNLKMHLNAFLNYIFAIPTPIFLIFINIIFKLKLYI